MPVLPSSHASVTRYPTSAKFAPCSVTTRSASDGSPAGTAVGDTASTRASVPRLASVTWRTDTMRAALAHASADPSATAPSYTSSTRSYAPSAAGTPSKSAR